MNQIFKENKTIYTEPGNTACKIEKFLGSGGQGEVYQVKVSGQAMALKWYYPHYLKQDTRLRKRLETLVKSGPPNDKFLWPLSVVTTAKTPGFGYLMTLREPRFKGIVDLMKGRVDPDFRALVTAGFHLADSYLQLHAKGLCYRDISFGNIFFDPKTGEIQVCDNDNVDTNGQSGAIEGTPRFMAPEVVRGEASPSTQTDLFSLAVLLFYMLVVHHPLEGAKEKSIKCMDLPAMRKLYGEEPIFIFDPQDDSNRPVKGYHDNALVYWRSGLYPQFLRDLFIRSFTYGIQDPQNGRVRESEWRAAMIKLRDSIFYCGSCQAENFYDGEALRVANGQPGKCWNCNAQLRLPFRIKLDNDVVMLNYDTNLYPHHLAGGKMYDFSQPVAAVNQHPKKPNVWGLKNLSQEKWTSTADDGQVTEIPPGRSITMAVGTRINFGRKDGEIRW